MTPHDLESAISFDKLMQLRFTHQTKQVMTGVQKKTNMSHIQVTLDEAQVKKGPWKQGKKWQSLMRQFHKVIKQQQYWGTGMGVKCGL
jgi:hypothetical protein